MDKIHDREINGAMRDMEVAVQVWRERWNRSQEELRDETARVQRVSVIGLVLGLVCGALFMASYLGAADEAKTQALNSCVHRFLDCSRELDQARLQCAGLGDE